MVKYFKYFIQRSYDLLRSEILFLFKSKRMSYVVRCHSYTVKNFVLNLTLFTYPNLSNFNVNLTKGKYKYVNK